MSESDARAALKAGGISTAEYTSAAMQGDIEDCMGEIHACIPALVGASAVQTTPWGFVREARKVTVDYVNACYRRLRVNAVHGPEPELSSYGPDSHPVLTRRSRSALVRAYYGAQTEVSYNYDVRLGRRVTGYGGWY